MPSRTAGIFLLLSRNNEDLQSAGRTIRDKCEKYLYRKAVCMSTGIRRGSVGNCTWSIDKYWTLTIEAVKGTDGVLDDYNLRGWPWEEYVKKIRKVFIKDGVAANTNMGFMFSGMKNCRVFDIAALDTGNAQMMDSLFYDCSNLTDLTPVAGWNVGSVTDMAFMFSGCTELSDLTPLAKWDVSHVRNTEGIFEACSGITDLSPLIKWDVSNVKVMAGLFAGCSGVTDLSPLAKWAVNNVEDMESMFVNCKAVTDISYLKEWDTGKLRSMSKMFEGCTLLADVSAVKSWNVLSLGYAEYTFNNTAVQKNPLDDMVPMSCPREGEFTGWKQCRDGRIVKLLIYADARRSSAFGKKCRCDKAKVVSIWDPEKRKGTTEAKSLHSPSFVYRKGETVAAPDYEEDRFAEYAPGIHFYMNRMDAVNY